MSYTQNLLKILKNKAKSISCLICGYQWFLSASGESWQQRKCSKMKNYEHPKASPVEQRKERPQVDEIEWRQKQMCWFNYDIY